MECSQTDLISLCSPLPREGGLEEWDISRLAIVSEDIGDIGEKPRPLTEGIVYHLFFYGRCGSMSRKQNCSVRKLQD